MLHDLNRWVADQSGGKCQSQFTAARLVEQTGRQPGPDGVQLQFGDQALQTEDEPAVGKATAGFFPKLVILERW